MSTDRDVTSRVRSWLDEGVTQLPDRVLDAVLDQVPATPQRRTFWLARRFPILNNNTVRFGIAAAAVLVAALVVSSYLPTLNTGNPGPTATPSPTASPMPLPAGESDLEPGTYRVTPFAGPDGFGVCEGQVGCVESPADDTIAVTVTVPDGWSLSGLRGIWIDSNAPPDGAMLILWRGGWLYEDPCLEQFAPAPSIEVGPSAEDFANALADHPLLDATTPVDVTLAGYAGKYVDVSAPSNVDQCPENYRLWEPGIYAQGPNQRWHLWILDVEGTRVVVQTMDYPETSADRRAELQAMVDSLEITP